MIIIGHRGASGLAPENTLPSFDSALRHKAAIVELDVQLTKDGHLVVIHDSNTKRVAFKNVEIKKSTLAEVQKLETKDGAFIPTLEEVLDHLGHKIKLNIELKSRGSGQAIMPIIKRMLEDKFTYDDFFISSFKIQELRAVRNNDKKVKLALLHRRSPFGFLKYQKKLNLFGAGFHALHAWPFIIKLANKRGLFTYVYTVNNKKSALYFKKWGCDAICTDYPDTFSQEDWHIIDRKDKKVTRHAF